MSRQEKIIVTGACGWIGRNVCQHLKEAGHLVVAADLVKQDGPWDAFVELDISTEFNDSEKNSLQAECGGGNFDLVHCAGYAHQPIETPEVVTRFHSINCEGTKRIVEWAKDHGISRMLYVSSIAFYDWEHDAGEVPITEDFKLAGKTAYSVSKLAGERLVIESGIDYRVVRLATVYGDGDRANFSKLAKAIKNQRFVIPGKGKARKSVISVEVASNLIAKFILMTNPKYRLVNLGFFDSPTLMEICRAYQECCGFTLPKCVPVFLLQIMALFGNLVSAVRPGFPLTTANLRKLTTSTSVDCSRAAELFPELKMHQFNEELRSCSNYYRGL